MLYTTRAGWIHAFKSAGDTGGGTSCGGGCVFCHDAYIIMTFLFRSFLLITHPFTTSVPVFDTLSSLTLTHKGIELNQLPAHLT